MRCLVGHIGAGYTVFPTRTTLKLIMMKVIDKSKPMNKWGIASIRNLISFFFFFHHINIEVAHSSMSQLQPNRIEEPYRPIAPPSILAQTSSAEYQEALSRPPSYMMRHGSQTASFAEDEQLHLQVVQELAEYYNRQNTRHNYLDRLLFWNTGEVDAGDGEKIKYKYALQSCISSQFRGTPFLIWTIIFIFAGCISVFTGPNGAQALWILLGVYLIVALISFQRRRKEARRIEDLERCIADQRLQRRALIDQSHPLPEGYYFEIQNHSKDHTHPVVTLLPPPPAYGN